MTSVRPARRPTDDARPSRRGLLNTRLLLLIAATTVLGGRATASVARLTLFDESPDVIRAGEPLVVRVNLPLDDGDTLRTHGGQAVVEFDDGSELRIRADSAVAIRQEKDRAIDLFVGRLSATIQHRDGRETRLNMGDVIAAVRGTELEVSRSAGDETTIGVVTGSVEVIVAGSIAGSREALRRILRGGEMIGFSPSLGFTALLPFRRGGVAGPGTAGGSGPAAIRHAGGAATGSEPAAPPGQAPALPPDLEIIQVNPMAGNNPFDPVAPLATDAPTLTGDTEKPVAYDRAEPPPGTSPPPDGSSPPPGGAPPPGGTPPPPGGAPPPGGTPPPPGGAPTPPPPGSPTPPGTPTPPPPPPPTPSAPPPPPDGD